MGVKFELSSLDSCRLSQAFQGCEPRRAWGLQNQITPLCASTAAARRDISGRSASRGAILTQAGDDDRGNCDEDGCNQVIQHCRSRRALPLLARFTVLAPISLMGEP